MALPAPTLAKYQEFTTSGTSFVTTSWTPTASRLYLAWVNVYLTGSVPGVPSMSGNGLTWTLVLNTDTYDGNQRRGALFVAYGSGTAGATTVSMGGVTHSASIVAILEQSGVTSTAAVLQSATAKNNNQQTLSITLGTFGDAANSTLGFYGYKTLSTGGATGMLPGSGFTTLVDDRIDTSRAVYVEYRLSSDTSVDASLTGATDPTYTGAHHIAGVAIEVGAASAWLVEAEVLLVIDPDDLPDDEEPEVVVPPPVVDVETPSLPATDVQATSARPTSQRTRDLPSALSNLERRLQRMEGQQATRMGFVPVLDEDPPTDWPDGQMWTRSTTGDLCYRVGGVVQVIPASDPIGG